MVKWRIKRGEKIAGEVSSSKVRQLAAAGKLKKTDLLCKEGTEKWVLAGSVKGLWQTKAPSQSEAVLAKGQTTPQAKASSSPGNAAQTGQDSKVGKEARPQQEATQPIPQQKATQPTPQQKTTQPVPQQETTQPVPQQEAVETPPHVETHEPPSEQEATKPAPEQEATKPAIQQEATETPPHVETHEPPSDQEATEPALQQEASTSSQEEIEEPEPPGIEPFAEPEGEFLEEPHPMTDDAAAPPRPKWLVPLIAGGIGCLLLYGLMSMFISGGESEVSQQQPQGVQKRQSDTAQQRPSRAKSGINLPLTQNFFPPNIEKNYRYTTKKFENNTTVPVYEKINVEKWDTDSELYFHEKGFRNYGQKIPYRVSNGYVQLKGDENWFRFLKLDAKVGDRWTPGDGEDGTLDWTGRGEIELFDFKTVDSVPVAIVEFTAKPELAVPAYLVPAAFDFGVMEDGNGPIEGKIRFELGDGLGMLRADAIVPQGTRHRNGGGRDSSDWIFATRLRNSPAQSDNAEKQPVN